MDALTAASPLEPSVHEDSVLVAQRQHQKQLNAKYDALFSTLCLLLDPPRSCAHTHNPTCDIGAWLSVMPTEHDNFDLTAQKFCDAFAVRYKKSPLSVPCQCDGCGTSSLLDHF